MAQTKKKRRRKHAGTQAGTVERRGRTSKPGEGTARGAKGTSKELAQQRRLDRINQPPTWRGAVIRAAISAVIFALAIVLFFNKGNIMQGVILGVLMFLMYIPLSYYTDRFLYNRRQRSKAAK